jgi:tetratricopeptide (TPR) repeat protein
MSEKRSCFVISPIGNSGSDERKRADDLYELVVVPALEKYAFDITRADKLPSAGPINTEVVKLVQDADLCVIDITGLNANVMYECGRRHETGRPSIIVAAKGEKLPFDIAPMRAVFYDLTDARATRNAVTEIQRLVDKMMDDGFQAQSSGESLASISDALKRIERRIDNLSGQFTALPPTGDSSTENISSLIKKLGGPIGAFNYALTQEDVSLAEALFPRLKAITTPEKFVKMVLCQAASMGSRKAISLLEKEIEHIQSLAAEDQQDIVGAYIQGIGRFDEEKKGLSVLEDFLRSFETGDGLPPAVLPQARAWYLNQYQKLLYGAKRFEDAIGIAEKVISLRPDDPSYYYNASINYEAIGNMEKAREYMDKCMNLDAGLAKPDDDHLARAVRVYAKCGQKEQCQEALGQLRKINPPRALVVAEDEDVNNLLHP